MRCLGKLLATAGHDTVHKGDLLRHVAGVHHTCLDSLDPGAAQQHVVLGSLRDGFLRGLGPFLVPLRPILIFLARCNDTGRTLGVRESRKKGF